MARIWPSEVSQSHPKTVIGCLLVCVAVFVTGLTQLTVSRDPRIFFSDENRQLLDLEAFERKFSENNNLLFVITHRDGGKVTNVETLQTLADITEAAWQLPHSTRVQSLTNFPRVISDEDSFSVVELVADPDSLDEAGAREVEQEALGDPLVVNRLISEDARATGINVNFQLPRSATPEVRAINAAAGEFAAKIESDHPTLQVHVTGNVALMSVFNEAALLDAQLLTPLALTIAGLVVAVFLRSLNATIVVVVMLGLASASAMGIAGWFGHIVTPASTAAPVIVISICLATAIHVVIAVTQGLSRGLQTDEAIRQGIQQNAAAVGLTNLTTMVGFLAMNLADSPPFREMGNTVTCGILISYVLTFTWLPAALTLFPPKPRADRSADLMAGLARIINRLRWPVLIFMTGLVVYVSQGLSMVRLDDDFVRYFDQRFDYRVASDFAEERLTGLNILEFELQSGSDGGVYDPEYQQSLALFTAWLFEQPGVIAVSDISEITRRIHRAMRLEDQPAVDGIPQNADLISQYFLLYEFSLPYGSNLTDVINVSRSASRVTVGLKGLTSEGIRGLNESAIDWLNENAPEYAPRSGVSINVVFSYLSATNIRAMMGSTIVSIFIIGVIIALALRSVSYGVLSLATNLLPAVVGFGIWGFFVQDIGLAGSVITAMTLGIVVDDTIHFLMKYRRQRMAGVGRREAIETVFSTVGVAMAITSISLTVGFIVLTLSGFQINRALGLQTSIIVVAALAICWFMLPPLLHLVDRKETGKPAESAP